MNNQIDIALSELDKVIKVFSQKQFPEKIAKVFIKGAGKPMNAWSLGNQFLVFLQESEDARGYKQWQEVGRNVKRGAKYTWFCEDFFIRFPCSVFMRWDMYEFAIDIPENLTSRGYRYSEQIISKQKMYIPIITFNADSSEMGSYAFRMAFS